MGPLGHPRPLLFRESRSCVVELVARQSTGLVCLSFQFRVSSWIVIAAHRREMYLVGGGGGPLDIVLSGSGRLVHGPLDGRCKARNWNTLIPLVPVLRFRACPSVWSVLHTVGQQSLHLFTHEGSPGPLFSLPFCLSVTRGLPDLLQREESRLNISAIGGSFARIQSSIIVHLAWIMLGEQQPFRHGTDLWANGSHFGQVSYENASESQEDQGDGHKNRRIVAS